MVEVFKTDVTENDHAHMLVEEIQKAFAGYRANFDLADSDKILRVQSLLGNVHPLHVIEILGSFGFSAEVLSDEVGV
jgi:hypothetical protein